MVDFNSPPALLDFGLTPNAADADTLRAAAAKTNDWFTYLLQAWFENGSSLIFGVGAPVDWDGELPDTSTGSDGKFYMDTEGFLLYGPRVSGIWGPGSSFQGPPGVALNGIPTGGAAGQALLKGTSQDFAVGWYNIIRSLGPELVVAAGEISEGSVLVKGTGTALQALGWLAFATNSTLETAGAEGALMVKVDGKFTETLLSVFALRDVEKRPDGSPEEIGDVLTWLGEGKSGFATPKAKVWAPFRGEGYEPVPDLPWNPVIFGKQLDPTAPVEMLAAGVMRSHTHAFVQITLALTLRAIPSSPVTSPAQIEVVLEHIEPGMSSWEVLPGSLRHISFNPDEAIKSSDFMWPHEILDLECLRVQIHGDANTAGTLEVVGPNTAIFVGS